MAQWVLLLKHGRHDTRPALVNPVNLFRGWRDFDVGNFSEAVFLFALYDFNIINLGKGHFGYFDVDVDRFALCLESSGILTCQFLADLVTYRGNINSVDSTFQAVNFDIYFRSTFFQGRFDVVYTGDSGDFLFNLGT